MKSSRVMLSLRSLFLWPLALCLGAYAFAQAPTITGFSPTTIGIGMPVVITGTNFASGAIVRFNGFQASSVVVNSPTQITVPAPSSLTPGPITVIVGGNTATSPSNYAVTLEPVITGYAPPSGPEKRVVTINGYNFLGTGISGRTVRLNGLAVGSTSASSTAISFAVPEGATTGPITVQTSQGLATGPDFIVAAGTPPINDNFANAQIISGPSGSYSGTNANATSEPNEPAHPGAAGGVSVWFRWTAPSSGYFLFNPADLSSNQFGIVQGIYTGTDLSSLTLVAGSATPTSIFARYGSAVALDATAGVTYSIALDGYTGLMASYRLSWSPLAVPTISSFNPTSGGAGQSVSLVISGSGFVPTATIRIGGVAVDPSRLIFNSSNSVSVTQIPFTALPGPITMTTELGTATSAASFSVTPAPAPAISGFSPTSAAVGSTVVVSGTSLAFGPGAPIPVIRFNGVPATFIGASSSTQISVRVPAGASNGPITVETTQGMATSASSFTVLDQPQITSFSPTAFAPGTSVIIEGLNFTNVLAVRFAGIPATFTTVSANSITAIAPPGITDGQITVTTSAGSAVSPTNYSVLSPGPTITGFSPAAITPTMAVTVIGTNLLAVQSVEIGGVPAQFTAGAGTQLTVRVPFGIPATGVITVRTDLGTAVSPASYTAIPAAVPSIASFSPTSIGPGAGVTITGSGFSDVTSVTFNGVSATFSVQSPTHLAVTAPSTGLTAGFITVNTSLGSATSPTPYTVSLAPVITSVTPSSGPENRIVVIRGFNFSGAGISNPRVRVNGILPASATISSTTCSFPIPVGATTGYIMVETSQGIATSPVPFTVAPGAAPANDNFVQAQPLSGDTGQLNGNIANATKEAGEPNHADNPGGPSVWFRWTAPHSGLYLFNPYTSTNSHYGIIQSIYTGTDVTALTRVATGTSPTSVFTRYESAAVLNAVAGTTYSIALDGVDGVMPDYRLTWAPLRAPTIASFTPSTGAAGQSLSLNINGTDFTPGATVSIGGAVVDSSRINYQSPTLITVTQIPAAAVTGPIVVTTPAGTATSSTPFVVPVPPPAITQFTPSGASVAAAVTISGSNFVGVRSVAFNGTPVASFSVVGSTTILTAVPAGASTGPITVVTDSGTTTSAASFVVVVLPTFTEQPQSQTVTVGSPVTFSVQVNSNGPEEYQWLKDAQPILGNPTAATRTLSLPSVGFVDAGSYTCRVVNTAGAITSDPATLTVRPIPVTITLSHLTATYDGSPKTVTATSVPDTALQVTYNGATAAPTNAGNYLVLARPTDPRYSGSASDTLVIRPATVAPQLGHLSQVYNGTPRPVTVTTTPAGLAVSVSYNGAADAPTLPGAYAVAATITDSNYSGETSAVLTVRTTALVRRLQLNGGVDGSVQLASAANLNLNGGAWISGDLLVPGTPNVRLNGHPTYGGTQDSIGAGTPDDYSVVLNGSAVLRHVIRRVDAVPLATVDAPPTPTGTRNVALSSSSQNPGDFATLRNLTLNGNTGAVTVPPGTYGDFVANGSSSFVLGLAGDTAPAVYNLQRLTLNGSARLQIAGPVLLTVAGNVTINGAAGSAEEAGWLTLRVASGDVVLNGNANLTGTVIAPDGTVTINSGALTGEVTADELRINGSGVLTQPTN